MATEHDYWNQMYANACDLSLPSVVWKPRLFIDGNQWCALYGENIQDGVAGFGSTPYEAMRDFDKNWHYTTISTYPKVQTRCKEKEPCR